MGEEGQATEMQDRPAAAIRQRPAGALSGFWLRLLIPDADAIPTPARKAAGLLLWLIPLAWIASYAFMASVPLADDEGSYVPAARAIADFLAMRGVGPGELADRAIGYGWFMPGVSIALAPLFVVEPNASLELIRLCAAACNFVLWVWAVRETCRALGQWYAHCLALLLPYTIAWLAFTATALGDLPAGLVLVVAFCRTVTLARDAFGPERPEFRRILELELVLALAVYLRGNLLLVALAIHVFLLALYMISENRRALAGRAARLGAGMLLFGAVIAPWSLAASAWLGGPVITTSSLPLVFGITFGDLSKLCFGPCPEGNIFYSSARHSRQVALAEGTDQLTVQRRMAAHALEGTTPQRYLALVRHGFNRFTTGPHVFPGLYLEKSKLKLDRETVERYRALYRVLSRAVLFPVLAFLLVANLLVIRRDVHAQVFSLAIRMFTLCIFVQPFLQLSHGRYWPTYMPFAILAAPFVASVLLDRPAAHGPAGPAPLYGGQAADILFALQFGYALLAAATLAVVLVPR